MTGLDWAVFYVPANTVQVIWETVFTSQKTQPTVSKYWRNMSNDYRIDQNTTQWSLQYWLASLYTRQWFLAHGFRSFGDISCCILLCKHRMYIWYWRHVENAKRERESRFLTTDQHIIGHTVSFTFYIFTRWTADNLKWQMTGYSN